MCEYHHIYQGFPTEMNCGPHTCESGLKAGRMKKNRKSFIGFQRILTYKTNNYTGLIGLKIVIQYFLVSLFHLFS